MLRILNILWSQQDRICLPNRQGYINPLSTHETAGHTIMVMLAINDNIAIFTFRWRRIIGC